MAVDAIEATVEKFTLLLMAMGDELGETKEGGNEVVVLQEGRTPALETPLGPDEGVTFKLCEGVEDVQSCGLFEELEPPVTF